MVHDSDSIIQSSHSFRYFAAGDVAEDQSIDFAVLLAPVMNRWRAVVLALFAGGAIAYGISFLVTPLYASHTTMLPPQAQQSNAVSALASLGAIGGLAAGGMKSPVDQYISLMQSETVGDRLIDRFDLMKVYDQKYRDATRKQLLKRATIVAGKKDGMITIEVEDSDPKRAAAMATQFVEELRRVTATLAVTEAQQRRLFFQGQMLEVKTKLTDAQTALQQSGFNQGALNAEPQSAASGYARLRTELATAQVRLATLENSLAPTAPEVRQQSATVSALQEQLRHLESSASTGTNSPDYVSKYREFKYEETLFDIMAKQYELARVDESREGALIQIVDQAHPAERRSYPRRLYFAAAGALAGTVLFALFLVVNGLQARKRREVSAAPTA
jgi:uncharacterized protein involved in exopolysaccharide biosynthesis